MGLLNSLQDANWNVNIPAGLWKGMSPPCGTGAQGFVGNQTIQLQHASNRLPPKALVDKVGGTAE